MSNVRIYLRGKAEPIELVGGGKDQYGEWTVTIVFKDNYVWVKRKWEDSEQALYTLPKANLFYVDWGNWEDESE